MKERPIIFNAEMVRAILDGRKTQTRRPFKNQPQDFWEPFGPMVDLHKYNRDKDDFILRDGNPVVIGHGFVNEEGDFGYNSPYGKVGDRLWVKETFGFSHQSDDVNQEERVVMYKAGEPYRITKKSPVTNELLKSTCGTYYLQPNHYCFDPNTWTPSIHMPRWASRITLEITDIRIERINDISFKNAISEGIKDSGFGLYGGVEKDPFFCSGIEHKWFNSPRIAFSSLWDSIYLNKKCDSPYCWGQNPFVWVYEFKVLEKTR